MSRTFNVNWNEDGSCTILGRVTARNGTGEATGISGEGNWIKQADVSTIVRKVFDLDGTNFPTEESSTSITVANVVIDVPVTSTAIWTEDTIGYNFLEDLANTLFPESGRRIRIEYVVTLTGGAVFHGIYEGLVDPVYSS